MSVIDPSVISAAQASHKKFWPSGPFVSVTLAQYGLESAWGKYPSGTNNFFGIKAVKGGSGTVRWTKEFEGGRYISIEQVFANYPDLVSGFDAHATLLMTSHYRECQEAQTPKAYCQALHDCGYATDPNYPAKLTQIIDDFNLTQYDQTFGDS
jgi:flagellum-specific peptidoglycan hydrolase FlgJ